MNKEDCLFCRIIRGDEHAWPVWEDEQHIAFLTPFPNTRGFTVVATKDHLPSYLFNLEHDKYSALLSAARTVGLLIDRALQTTRTGLIAEGMGVNHAHVKLIPMHGIPDGEWSPVLSRRRVFYETYPGYVASHDGPEADSNDLEEVARLIRNASKSA